MERSFTREFEGLNAYARNLLEVYYDVEETVVRTSAGVSQSSTSLRRELLSSPRPTGWEFAVPSGEEGHGWYRRSVFRFELDGQRYYKVLQCEPTHPALPVGKPVTHFYAMLVTEDGLVVPESLWDGVPVQDCLAEGLIVTINDLHGFRIVAPEAIIPLPDLVLHEYQRAS